MICTEDQFRNILREEAADITQESIPPLWLPDREPTSPSRNRTRIGRSRWARSRWLQGLAAAAAVTAVAIAATTITTGTGGHRSGGGNPTAVAPGRNAHASIVPPYYVAILYGQNGLVTTVRDSKTDARLATVTPPRGYRFVGAAPGTDNDSFVLEANQDGGPPRLYLLRFNPSRRTTSLSRLPIPALGYIAGLAVSPSGKALAMASPADGGRSAQLQIYTLSGKLVRRWQSPGEICFSAGLPCLSWSSSGYLAFTWASYGSNSAAHAVRRISAAAGSGSLLDASRQVIPPTQISGLVLSGNGARIASGVLLEPRQGAFNSVFEEFSATTGKLISRSWPGREGVAGIGTAYWSNWTGSELLVRAQFPQTSPKPQWLFGILAHGKFSPLPTPAGSYMAFAF